MKYKDLANLTRGQVIVRFGDGGRYFVSRVSAQIAVRRIMGVLGNKLKEKEYLSHGDVLRNFWIE